jgi:hypothetical protein
MARFKRNQVEEAIFRTLGAQGERVDELRFRIKRLLVTDRHSGCDAHSEEEGDRHYAFFSQKPPGSGTEVKFSGYEAFALLAATMLLEHGLPQGAVVKVMRQVRARLEIAHAQTLKKDHATLFDQQAIRSQAKPGMLAIDNTLSGSTTFRCWSPIGTQAAMPTQRKKVAWSFFKVWGGYHVARARAAPWSGPPNLARTSVVKVGDFSTTN